MLISNAMAAPFNTSFNMPSLLAALGPNPQVAATDGSQEAFIRRTSFFVNIEWELGSTNKNAKNILGQMYVESLEPQAKHQPYPIILIHGDQHTGQIWLTKPDGCPGWASYFSKQGYHVYVVDLPPVGRSNYLNCVNYTTREIQPGPSPRDAFFVERELTAPSRRLVKQQAYPTAKFHDKWPGSGRRGDPIFANYCASLVTMPVRRTERQTLAQNALQALLQVTGRAVLVGEGAGATAAWLATDVQADLVQAVVAIEPSGPPCGTPLDKNKSADVRTYTENIRHDPNSRPYGLTDIPLSYDPPANLDYSFALTFAQSSAPLDVKVVNRSDGKGSCVVQKDLPASEGQRSAARQLLHLRKVPHAIITAPASPHSTFDWATVEFMRQAGAQVDWLKLDMLGIYGNGHLMFLETNSDVVAGTVDSWIRSKTGPGPNVAMCMPDSRPEPLALPETKQTLQELAGPSAAAAVNSPGEQPEGAGGSSGSESMDLEDSEPSVAGEVEEVEVVDLSLPPKPVVSFPVSPRK
ncbi:putative secreted lipase [Paramyrothecium foliicola]|nr:putative secreted lipase [Paramyrothecium foliicola]